MKLFFKHFTSKTTQILVVILLFGILNVSGQKKNPPARRAVPNPGVNQKADALVAEGKKLAGEKTAESLKTAAAKFNEAAQLYKTAKNKKGEAVAHYEAGVIYENLAEYDNAIESYQKAVAIQESLRLVFDPSVTYRNLGRVFVQIGKYANALSSFNQSLNFKKRLRVRDEAGEAETQIEMALAHLYLGNKLEAASLSEKSLHSKSVLYQETANPTVAHNIGRIFYNIARTTNEIEAKNILRDSRIYGFNDLTTLALVYFSRALKSRERNQDKRGTAQTLTAIADILSDEKLTSKRGEYSSELSEKLRRADLPSHIKPSELYERTVSLWREAGNLSEQSYVLMRLAELEANDRYEGRIFEFYAQAMTLSRAAGNRRVEAMIADRLMRLLDNYGMRRIAIFYGKQAVNVIQEIRGDIKNLDRQSQQNFLRTNARVYRHLADILIADGRLAEAEYVLSMLKEEEYFGFIRRDAAEAAALSKNIEFGETERKAFSEYARLADELTKKGTRYQVLFDRRSNSGGNLSPVDETEYLKLKKEVEDASEGLKKFLQSLAAEFSKKVEDETIITPDSIASFQANLQEIGTDTVLISTYLLPERYRVIVSTGNTMVDRKVEYKEIGLTEKQINDRIFAFKQILENPCACYDPRPLGMELYNIFVKPIEKDLDGAKAKVLLWSLDGVLRYIPVAALYDGKQYLAERYQNVLVTLGRRENLFTAPTTDGWRAFGAGVSEKKSNFSKLPAVEGELFSIVNDETRHPAETQGVLPGRRMLNGEFNLQTFRDTLSLVKDGKSFNLVHLATHFKLGNTNSDSALLLGDGGLLSLYEIDKDKDLRFGKVELLTLSACDTGARTGESNGREVESLGMLAQKKGAKAVLATLWKVADCSTGKFMSEFYRTRKTHATMKSAALQTVQNAMISGAIKEINDCPKRTDIVQLEEKNLEAKHFPFDKSAPFAHPYFWSPFVLIGNWR